MEQTTHTEVQAEVSEEKNETTHHIVHHHANHKKKFSLSTPLAIIIAALILAVSHIAYAVILNSKNTSPVTMFAGAPISEKDYPTGNKKSDVVVVEYSDTECPFCARLHPAISKIQSEYADKVSFVYRYFPLTQIHPDAFVEAQSVECVGEQLGSEKRKEFISQMFTKKIANNSMVLSKAGREELAKNVGVDMKAFTSCVDGENSSIIVNNSIQDGVAAGVTGTPATFILKKHGDKYEVFALIEGAREYDYFKAAIDAALK